MLQAIRERAQGWIAWAIVILITIPFAFWGVNEYFSGASEINVATVNDQEIPRWELQRAYQMQRQQLQEALGGRALPDFLDEATLKRQVLNQLIRQSVIFQSALDLGYRVADQQVAAFIGALPAFQQSGRFDNRSYEQGLRAQGMTQAGFEMQVRKDIMSRQLSTGILETAFVTDREVKEWTRLENQERDVVYFVIPTDKFRNEVSITEDEVQAYYESHQDRFIEPEKVMVEYIELKTADLGKDVEPSDDELRQLYDEQREQFTVKEERRASHILIPVDPKADEATLKAARDKANEALKRIREGETFEDVAREVSEDPGSAEQGGDLGFFGRSVMVPAFEDEAFRLEVGQISEPIKSSFGFHIIKLTERRAGGTKPFEEVRADLVVQYRQHAAEQRFYDLSDQLANLTYEHPDSLAVAAESLELAIQTSEPFSPQGGSGIAAQPKVIKAAFSDDVLSQGNNSEVIELAPDHLLVLRVKEHTPDKVRALDEVRDEIRENLADTKAREQARERGESLAERVSDLEAFKAAAAEVDSEVSEPGFVNRRPTGVDPAILKTLFRLVRPTEGQLTVGHAVLPKGDYALIGLIAVREGEPPEQDDDGDDKEQQRRSLQGVTGENELTGLLAELESKADIVIHQAED